MAEDQVKLSEILGEISGALHGQVYDTLPGNPKPGLVEGIVSKIMQEAGLAGSSKSTAAAALEFLEGRKSLTFEGKPFKNQELVRQQVLENNEGAIESLRRKTLSVSQVRAAARQEILDKYLARLAGLGIDAKRIDLVKAVKEDGDLRGIVKTVMAKDEKGMLTKHEYEIAENDFIETFVASQLRSKLSPAKPKKYLTKGDQEKGLISFGYQEADKESKAVNSILGELGFATSGNIAGGITRGVALKIRSISMDDPETAAMLLSILTYDSKGNLRSAQGISDFRSDFVKIVNAVAKTSVGSVEERITEALIKLGDSAKRWAKKKNLPFVPVFDKKGAVDIDKTLARYREGSKEYKALYKLASTLTLPQAEEAVSKVSTKRSAKAAAAEKRAKKRRDQAARKREIERKKTERREDYLRRLSSYRSKTDELYLPGKGLRDKVSLQELLDQKEKRLREIKDLLSKAVGNNNAITNLRERTALSEEAEEIGTEIAKIAAIAAVFRGYRPRKNEMGLEQLQKDEIPKIKLTDRKLYSLLEIAAIASDPSHTSLSLSEKEQLAVAKKIKNILNSTGLNFKLQEAELILGGAVMPVTEEVAASLLHAAKQKTKDIRAALDQIKSELGIGGYSKATILGEATAIPTPARAKAMTKAQQRALDKILKDTKNKNNPLQLYQLFAQRYIKAAQDEYHSLPAGPRRAELIAQFHTSVHHLVKGERRLLASLLGQDGITDSRHAELTLFDKYLFMAAQDPRQYRAVNITKSGELSGDSSASAGLTASATYILGLLSRDERILGSGITREQRIAAANNILFDALGIAQIAAGDATVSGGKIISNQERTAKRSEEKATREKEALETIRRILAGDKAAFSDPAEILKLVSFLSSTRSGKLTATNFIQSLLQKISDKGKVGASPEDLSKLARLIKFNPDGTMSGPKTGAIFRDGGRGLLDIADSLLKQISPEKGTVIEPGQELAASITGAFNSGAEIFKGVAGKKLQKTLTDAATEAEEKLAQAQERRAKAAERAASGEAGPRVRSTRAKLGELTKNEAGEFVDAKGLPLGFKGKGFASPTQGMPKQGEAALGKYLASQGLIGKPEDLVMKPGEGRGSKPIIDLDKTKFVSETAKEIAGIVQDVRAKAMKIDPATGAKVTSQVADSLAGLLKGPSKGGVGSSGPIGKALASAIDEAMADPTVKRTFTRGGVKMEQTAPEFVKERQDIAAEKGKKLTPAALRKRFLKDFKGTAATAVAARLGVDVAPGVDPGKAIAENLAAGKASKAQAAQERDQAKEVAKRIRALRREVRFRQGALADQTKVGGELEKGQPGVATTAAIRSKLAMQRVRSMPLHERRAAYAQMGLGGAPARAAGGAPQGQAFTGQAFTGQGMQFVPGATIAIPQVDIGPLKELASQMSEVGKMLALIPKATIPKGMSASLREIASLMQVLATVKAPPKGANVSAFKKLIQDLNSLAASFGGKAPNTKNAGNIIAALRLVNKILDALSSINTKTPAKTLLANMQEFKKSLSFIPKMFSTLGTMDFAAISNIGATIASTKFPSQQRLAGINEALLMIKQILETANGMKGGRIPSITGSGAGGRRLYDTPAGSRIRARQDALAKRIQGPGFERDRGSRFGASSRAVVRAMPLQQRLNYYDQIREEAAAGGGRRPPRERPVRTGGGGGGNRFGGGGRDRGYSAPAGQFGVPRQIGGPMGPQISTGGVQQFSNDAMGILGNLAQQIRFGFTQEITREIAQSFGRILAHLKDGIVKFNSTIETATVAFQTLFENEQKAEGMEVNFKKAKEEAEGLVEAIKKFANVTPFRFPQLAESARRMRAFGFETAEIMPNMQSIGDAVAALGGEDDKIFRITYALGQMRQAGRVYQNDMMQLANAGIAGYDILSKALLRDFVKLGDISITHNGKVIDETTVKTEEGYDDLVAAINAATNKATRSQVKIAKSSSSTISDIFTRVSNDPIEAIRDLTQSGQIAGGAAASAIIEGLGQEYGGGMRKLSQTFEGAFSTLADVTQAFVADITKPIFESIRDEMIELGRFLQSMFVSNVVKNVAKGFSQIVGPVQEIVGSIYSGISSIISGIIDIFGEVTGAFSLMEERTVDFFHSVSGSMDGVIPFKTFKQLSDEAKDLLGQAAQDMKDFGDNASNSVRSIKIVTTTFDKTRGAAQEFISRIGGGLKIVADLMRFPLAKGLAAAAIGFKVLSLAWNANPLLLSLTAVTVSLTYFKDLLSTESGSGFARGISGIAASLTDLARNFKQQILPLLAKMMEGVGTDFFIGLVATLSLMVPILRQMLALFNSILELINALPFLPNILGMAAGVLLLKKMLTPLGKVMMGTPASMDVRGNPIAATGGLLGKFESAIRTLTAKLLPMSTLLERGPTTVMQRGAAQVPVGTLGRLGVPTGYGAVAGNLQKTLVPAADKKMLSSQVLKKLLNEGVIRKGAYDAAMAARRAAIDAALQSGTGPGGITGLRALAKDGGGLKAALSALGNQFADPSLNVNVRVNAFTQAIAGLFKVLRNLRFVVKSVNGIKSAGIAIGSFTKSLSLAAKALPKAAFSAINRLLKSFVLASALKFNSTIFSLVPRVFVPFMDAVKATGPRGTGGDIVGSVRRAAAAGMNRAGRLSLAGAQVPFAMPKQGVTGGPIGYLVRAIRGLRPNRLPFEAPGQAAASVGQRVGPINRIIEAVVRRTATQVPVGTLGAPGRPSGFGAIIGRLERVLLNVTQGSVAQAPGRIRPQVLGGSPSMYGVSIFKVIQERIKYLTGKVADTAGLYAARITTAFEKSFMAFHRMMIRLAGAPARIFTMQNFDKIITRYAEAMVKAFTPKTAPIAGFLAGGTKKAPTELFAGLKDAIARRVIPNTLVGAPGPTFTDKIFAGADKLAKVSERFAEMMVKGFAPRTVPIEKFLAGGTVRAPKELFAGLKDAIARIVIPDKFTQPISLFQRAVMFFQSATSRFGSFVRAIGSAGSSAAGGIAGGLGRLGAAGLAGGAGLFAAVKQSRALQSATAAMKTVSSGLKTVVSKFGVVGLVLQGVVTAMTIGQRMGAEKDNQGAILAQEGAGMAGSIGGFLAAPAIGKAIGGGIGTFIAGPIGGILASVIGGAIANFAASIIFPNREITPAEQDKTAKEAAIAKYMQDQVMSAEEFTQLLTDFDFTPIELLDLSKNYYGSVDSVFERIQNGVSTLVPSIDQSLSHMLMGLGDRVNEEIDGVTFTDFAGNALEQIRAAIAQFYQNKGSTPQEAMVLAQNELAINMADFGQVKTLEDAQSLLEGLANSWQVNISKIKGFNLFIGQASNQLEKLQTALEKVRSEFQKIASRLQSRINAVFEQQMAKAIEKAKDAFLATQIVMVEGAETNILALREEIEATEKRNKLLSIEKKLRDAARSVEMARLGQYDASMDPLEAAARMREAQDAQTEAVKEAALERKKIALEEAMASDPVVAGLEDVDERFEAARLKFQEGMEDILDLVEAGKLTGTQAAAKIKELYTSTLGEVGVLDANLDVDAKNFGNSFLNTWETILKKFETLATRLKKAIAAVTNYDPNAGGATPPGTTTGNGNPNDSSNYGGRGFDNWREFGVKYEPKALKAAVDARIRAMMDTLIYAASSEGAMKAYPKGRADRNAYQGAAARALTQFTSTSGIMYKASAAAAASKPEAASNLIDTARNKLGTYFQYVDELQNSIKLKNPIAGMASGGTIMGEGGMFRVGEAGRETLQVVPGGVARVFPRRIRPINQIGMAGGSGGGINASVIINNPTVRSDQDIRKLADAVGKAQSSLLRSAGIGRI